MTRHPLVKIDIPGFSSRTRIGLLLLAVVLLPNLIMWPYRQAGFVSDDIFFAKEFREADLLKVIGEPWPHPMGVTKAWRPLVLISYLATAEYTDGSPESYRLFNYLIHGFNALLLTILVRQSSGRWIAGAVAGGLFAIHPMIHEGVIWISGRTYPMAAFFALALCVWTAGAPARGSWPQHLVGVMLFVCALASYEFAVVLPFVLVLVACSCWRDVSPRQVALFVSPYVAILAAYLAFRWIWLSGLNQDFVVFARASQWANVGPITTRVPLNVMSFTLHLLTWPWFEQLPDARIGANGILTTVLALVSGLVVWLSRASWSQRLLWPAWIALWFAPVLASMGFSDRFGYLSAAGLAALIGTAAVRVLDSKRPLLAAGHAAMLVAVAIGWAADLRSHGRNWVKAGEVATDVLDQVVQLEPFPSRPTTLHFLDVPRRAGSALVFMTYFPEAVAQRYPAEVRENLTFRLYWDALPSIQSRAPIRVYQWDARTEQFRVIWRGGESGAPSQ